MVKVELRRVTAERAQGMARHMPSTHFHVRHLCEGLALAGLFRVVTYNRFLAVIKINKVMSLRVEYKVTD